MNEIELKLKDAQNKAEYLFLVAEQKGYFVAGQTEKELNTKIYDLAYELFGIKKYWHKRIIRAGANTLFPYRENPPDLLIQPDDIFFFDFGPVFEDWEADLGKTFAIGNDPYKIKLSKDVEHCFNEGKEFFKRNQENLTGSEFYAYTMQMSKNYGWEFGNRHAGHLIGNFPHETILGDEVTNYIHPDNHQKMSNPDSNGQPRHWIYEIHFVDREKQIGGFYEALLTI